MVLLPVRTVLWGIHRAELLAGRTFDLSRTHWWIAPAAASGGRRDRAGRRVDGSGDPPAVAGPVGAGVRYPAMSDPGRDDQRLRELERSFRAAGLPLLAQDYRATEDVFTRAIPLLALVFVLELLGAVNLEWSVLGNAFAILGGLALLLGAFGILNVLRGRRFVSIPSKVGLPELTAFVVLPVVLPLVFGGQLTSALVTGLANLALLGAVWLVVGFGVLSILRWTVVRFFRLLRASLTLLVRALPLLLFFSLVTFFTNEYWQLFGLASDVTFYAAAGLFALLAAAFLLVRLPGSVRDLERGSGLEVPLGRRQRVNVGLVIFIAQALQVAFVGVAIWAFFMVFGSLLVTEAIRADWIGSSGRELFTFAFLGEQLRVTRELVRTAAGVASFSALYYAVASAVDSTYRDEFVDQLTQQLRTTFERRAEYLRLLAARDARRASGARSAAGA